MPRGLLAFWSILLSAAGGGMAYLQYLGPPEAAVPAVQVESPPVKLPLPPPPAPARIGILVTDLGDDAALSLLEAGILPPGIPIAVSPYGAQAQAAVAALRASLHDVLLLLPMPVLIASAPAAQNQAILDWSLSQIQDFAGASDAYGPALGGGFMADASARAWLINNLASKNLYFVEGDKADVIMDGQVQADIAGRLARLVQDADSHHASLGILVNTTAGAVNEIADWTKSLPSRNVMLVPVSTLAPPPQSLSFAQEPSSP